MGARVLFRDSQGRDGQVDLNPAAPLYVGRALDCAIRTDDAMVSRKHSMIRMENGRFYVEDLGSSNGTHVNDMRVNKHPLSHNDVVRCGSLWLRFIEDAPAGAGVGHPAPGPVPGGPGGPGGGPMGQGPGPGPGGPHPGPGRRGGTQRLKPAEPEVNLAALGAGGASPAGGGGVGPGGPIGGHPQSHGSPAAGGPGRGAGPSRHGSTLGPGRGAMRAGAGPSVVPAGGGGGGGAQLFGGPPDLPADGVVGGDVRAPRPSSGPSVGDEDSVVVNMADGSQRMRKDLDEALAAVEKLQIAYDREVADGKRLRAEIVTHKDRIDELRRALGERDEVVDAHGRVADELREEIRQAKDSLAASRQEAAEMADLVAARERQLGRSQEDMGQLKREIEDRERRLGELSRTKDEGWKKLNEQLTEIEHLREVITQQERMLEERRVGLVSQDELIKELRSDKEQHLRDVAHLKAERDELRHDVGRLNAQVAAIDEENKRLTQLLAEHRARRGPRIGDDESEAQHTAAVAAELKSLRIALKTVESDRDHLQELYDRADGEIDKLREREAKLEVELRESNEKREQAAAGRGVSDEAVTRAELDRHKAVEEAMAATVARQEAERGAEELRRELDRARRRVTELEKKAGPAGGPDVAALADQNRRLEQALDHARERLAELEREVKGARADAAARRDGAAGSGADDHGPEGEDRTAVVSAGRNPATIKDRAIEVHDAINDVLSELRNNALILHDEFGRGPSELSSQSFRIMGDAIEAVLGQAEEAKGVLRKLRELVEFGDD